MAMILTDKSTVFQCDFEKCRTRYCWIKPKIVEILLEDSEINDYWYTKTSELTL
jgi:hypothetical protein